MHRLSTKNRKRKEKMRRIRRGYQLQAFSRRAFVPTVFVDIYHQHPLLASLFKRQQ